MPIYPLYHCPLHCLLYYTLYTTVTAHYTTLHSTIYYDTMVYSWEVYVAESDVFSLAALTIFKYAVVTLLDHT
jgi:hypothetical protein